MRAPCIAAFLALATGLTLTPRARADQPPRERRDPAPSVHSESVSIGRSTRATVWGEDVIPGERQVGFEQIFVTSDAGLGGAPLRFTDLVVTGIVGRSSLGERFELAARLDLLAKQPHPAREPVVNGGLLEGRFQLTDAGSIFLAGAGQQAVGGPAIFADVTGGWNGRMFIDKRERNLALAGKAAVGWTRALRSGSAAPPWLVELETGGALEVINSSSSGDEGAGFTLSTDFAFRLARGGEAFWVPGAPAFRAGTRVTFSLAAFVLLAAHWDLHIRWSTVDRGDVASPATRLPLLIGGFDQSQLVFGLAYRFDES
jgi:hypothetical protein